MSAAMERALIIGASGGIGAALVTALEARGVAVTGLSRSADGFDVTEEASVEAGLLSLEGPFDLVLVATGALSHGAGPEKSLDRLTPDEMLAQYRLNAVGPAMVLKHARRLLPRQGRAVFAALSARVGSIGDNGKGGWYSYRAAKAGLNQVLHGASIELGRSHPQAICVALHPGTVQTELTRAYLGRHPAVTPHEAAENLLGVIERLTPAQSGGFFDWRGDEVPW